MTDELFPAEQARIMELAAAEKINQSYVCRVLRLTLLDPALVEAILDGRHPSRLLLRALLNPFPSDWSAQAHYFASGVRFRPNRRPGSALYVGLKPYDD